MMLSSSLLRYGNHRSTYLLVRALRFVEIKEDVDERTFYFTVHAAKVMDNLRVAIGLGIEA